MKQKFILIILVMCLLTPSANSANEDTADYRYQDTKFEKIVYDESFFHNILLERDRTTPEKYEYEKNIIKRVFPDSTVTAFDFDEFNQLDANNKTIIIVFRDHKDLKLDVFLKHFLPIKPFAKTFLTEGSVCDFTHIGNNGEKFLVVKQAFDFQSKNTQGKGLEYIVNFLSKIAKVSSFKHRQHCYKPSDYYTFNEYKK
jgi:hypothetical protein